MHTRSFESVSAFTTDSGDLNSGPYRIADNGLPIDLYLSKNDGQPLLVFLHGAKTRKVDLPWFVGAGMGEEHKASRLSITDPSLYIDPELGISWYAGNNKQQDLAKTLAAVIARVASKISADRIILIGGSGGGFASMSIGAFLKGSIALVWNPQTNIRRYYKRFVDDYAARAWKGESRGIKAVPRSDLTRVYAEPLDNTVIYLQNANDEFHVANHMEPFMKSLHADNRCYFYCVAWADGHVPPPKDQISTWIKFALAIDKAEGIQWEKLSRTR